MSFCLFAEGPTEIGQCQVGPQRKGRRKVQQEEREKNKKLKTRRKGDAFGSGGEDVDLVPSLAEFIRTGEERLIHLWKCRSKNYNPVS